MSGVRNEGSKWKIGEIDGSTRNVGSRAGAGARMEAGKGPAIKIASGINKAAGVYQR